MLTQFQTVQTSFQRGGRVSEADLKILRKNLLNEKGALLNRSLEFKTELQSRDLISDEGDQTSCDLSMNSSIQIREKDRIKISLIDRALEKIESGTFGQCEECGETIGAGRLKAYPFSPFCIYCQEDHEDPRRSLN